MSRSTEIRAFDLFCGGGGSSIGAKQAGAVPVGGVDLWSVAIDAFQANFPNARGFQGDLNYLSARRVASEVGRVDLLLASPECTHHSVAKGNKPRSEESKQLAYQVIRFAEVFEPRWVVVENVIQMERWHAFADWLHRLEKMGYKTLTLTLRAEDFGVPQTRRRLFVICDREREPSPPRTYRKSEATVKSVLDLPQNERWSYAFTPLDNGKRAKKTIARAERAIEIVGAKETFVMVYYGSDGAGGFQTIDRPLRTITTLDRFAIVRPNCVGHEMRMLQPSELAAAMGFPVSYRFPMSATRRDCIKLMGNAVCPPVMRAVVRSLVASS